MNSLPLAKQSLPDEGERARIEELLRTYPKVSKHEAGEILRFVKDGPAIWVGLLTADDKLKGQLDAFRRDYAAEFSVTPREYIMVAALIIALAGACFFLWDIGIR
jgi:hypothetical protein